MHRRRAPLAPRRVASTVDTFRHRAPGPLLLDTFRTVPSTLQLLMRWGSPKCVHCLTSLAPYELRPSGSDFVWLASARPRGAWPTPAMGRPGPRGGAWVFYAGKQMARRGPLPGLYVHNDHQHGAASALCQILHAIV